MSIEPAQWSIPIDRFSSKIIDGEDMAINTKNLKNWAYTGLVLLFVGTIPLSIISLNSFERINRQRIEVTERYGRAVALSENLRYRKSFAHSLALLYYLTRNKQNLTAMNLEKKAFLETIIKLEKLNLGPESKTLLKEISDTVNELFIKSLAGWSQPNIEKYRKTYVVPLNVKSVELINQHYKLALDKITRARFETDELSHQLRRNLVFTLILTLIGYIFVFLLLRKLIRFKQLLDRQQLSQFKQVQDISLARKEILETVSHDLKSPLTTIQLVTQMFQRLFNKMPDQKEKLEKNLSTLQNATERMKDLVEDLLDASKTESGNLILDIHEETPTELIQEAVESVTEIAHSKNIKLSVDNNIKTTPHLVKCDRKRIHQVFSNLLGNALKFTPPGGEIKIGFNDTQDACTFFVKDTGNGISEEQIPHLFDRYWQAEKKGKTGTGLGLSIVKSIIEKHDGKIEVQSTVGAGTIFRFQLPVTSV